MPKQKLGQLQEVPLREVFDDEPNDFTPWLADNLGLLGRRLGADLRFWEREAPVGPFFADLVAEMNGSRKVVIENQLAASDHRHLGQCLTYAAGVNADTVIWIAPEFTEQHLRAMVRLNRTLRDDLWLFAVRLELLRVGRSKPIPDFRVVLSPDGWFPLPRDPLRLRGEGFFERLCLEADDERLKSGDNSGFEFMAGAPFSDKDDGISYALRFRGSDHGQGTSVHLWIETDSRPENERIFEALGRDRHAIEVAVGRKLSWERNPPGRRACAIRAHGGGSIDDPPAQLLKTRADMIECYRRLRGALDHRVETVVGS